MQLPNALGNIPPNVNVVDYLNWLMAVQDYQQQQDRAYERDLMQQQSAGSERQFNFLQQLLKDAQDKQLAANNANQSRYSDILGSINSGLSGVMSDLDGFGQSQAADINRQFDTNRNNLLADLANRGMSGSTARIPIEASVSEGRNRGMMQLNDMLRDRKSSARERFLDRTTGVMERRTDAHPDMSPIAGFANQLGALGGGGSIAPGSFSMGRFAQPTGPGAKAKPNMVSVNPLSMGGRAPAVNGAQQVNSGTSTPGGMVTGSPLDMLNSNRPHRFSPTSMGNPVNPFFNSGPPMLGGPPMLSSRGARGVGQRSAIYNAPPPRPQAVAPDPTAIAAQRQMAMGQGPPSAAYLYSRNAYSPSPGMGGSPKFLVPSGYGQGQQVPTVPGMVGGPMGGGSLYPGLPIGPVGVNYHQPVYAPQRPRTPSRRRNTYGSRPAPRRDQVLSAPPNHPFNSLYYA